MHKLQRTIPRKCIGGAFITIAERVEKKMLDGLDWI
jgi:hypothetical protein